MSPSGLDAEGCFSTVGGAGLWRLSQRGARSSLSAPSTGRCRLSHDGPGRSHWVSDRHCRRLSFHFPFLSSFSLSSFFLLGLQHCIASPCNCCILSTRLRASRPGLAPFPANAGPRRRSHIIVHEARTRGPGQDKTRQDTISHHSPFRLPTRGSTSRTKAPRPPHLRTPPSYFSCLHLLTVRMRDSCIFSTALAHGAMTSAPPISHQWTGNGFSFSCCCYRLWNRRRMHDTMGGMWYAWRLAFCFSLIMIPISVWRGMNHLGKGYHTRATVDCIGGSIALNYNCLQICLVSYFCDASYCVVSYL